MKNADMPAMPISEEDTDRLNEGVFIYTGLTKREHFAAMAMKGIVSNDTGFDYSDEDVARYAVKLTDSLLAELEKTQ